MANGAAATVPTSEILAYTASFVAGLFVCLGLSIAAGGAEAVDTPACYPIGAR